MAAVAVTRAAQLAAILAGGAGVAVLIGITVVRDGVLRQHWGDFCEVWDCLAPR